jgi:4-hydroxybenzoate polyprenyltransferase
MDKDRDIDYTTKELGTVAMVSFILGITLMIETFILYPITLLFAISSILLVIAYCVKLKRYAISNKFVLVFSHIVFPYLMIAIQTPALPISWGEIFFLLTFLAFSFSGQVIHEAIDQEAIQTFSQRKIQIIVQIASIITIIFGVWAIILLNDYYLLPFIVVPLGPMYIYRKPRPPGEHVKDVGIIIGNLIMVYLIILILT